MSRKKRIETYNDGVLYFGKVKSKLGKANKKIGEEFSEEGTLFFEELEAREQDYHLFQSMGKELSLKLKTQCSAELRKTVGPDSVVKIDSMKYEVSKTSMDKQKTTLYWYLTRVGEKF